jgi:predicted nucleic acid-binding protein
MKYYLIDTDISSYFLRGKYNLNSVFVKKGIERIRVSVLTIAELKVLANKNTQSIINLQRINEFAAKVGVLDLDEKVWEVFSKLKAEALLKGKVVGDFDILNASIAKRFDCIMVTNNVSHYSQFIQIENWINE